MSYLTLKMVVGRNFAAVIKVNIHNFTRAYNNVDSFKTAAYTKEVEFLEKEVFSKVRLIVKSSFSVNTGSNTYPLNI